MSINPGATTLARTLRRAPSSATWRHRPWRPAFDASYAGSRLPGCSPATELDEHDGGAFGQDGQRLACDEEVAAQVDRERRVPVARGRTGQSAGAAPDADVEHEAVEAVGSGVGDQCGTVVLRRDVGDDDAGFAAIAADQLRRLACRGLVAIGADHRCAFARGEHRDRPAVPDRRVRFVGRLGARSDHEDAAAGEAPVAHPLNPGTPGSRCTPSEFSVKATRW